MKKLFCFLAAGMLLASCSNDDLNGVKGNSQEVSITVELPSAISSRAQASGQNSALGGVTNMESLNVTFTAALYYGSNPDPIWEGNASCTAATHSVTFKPTLVVGETYRLVSYAQFDGTAILEEQEEAFGINDETQDAYFVSTDIVAEPVMSAVLKRPSGKLRLVANDYAEMKRQLGKDIKTVTVTYEDARYTTFNAKTGLWSGEAATTEYSQAKTTYGAENGKDAITVFADYIPVNTTTGEEHVSMVVDVTFTDDTHFTREINIDVPIKRNYLTTLVGNFFTSEMALTLTIDPVFENQEEYNYSELATAFELGGEYKLYSNMSLAEGLVLVGGKSLTIDLNGYAIINDATSASDAVAASAIVVEEGSTLTIKDSSEAGTGIVKSAVQTAVWARGGNVVIEGGNYFGAENAVYASARNDYKGTAVINGGRFESSMNDGRYTLNLHDASGKAGNASITVYGGDFVNFDPANNKAENPAVSFVAEDYKSVTVGNNTYRVLPADYTAVLNYDELLKAVNDGATYIYLVNDIEATAGLAGYANSHKTGVVVGKGVTFDGNGKTLTINGATTTYASNVFMKGGTLKNVNLVGGFRCIVVVANEDVTIDNVSILPGANVGYTINVCGGTFNETVKITNSKLYGWTSWNCVKMMEIENCTFGNSDYYAETEGEPYVGNAPWNHGIAPWNDAVLTNCTFTKEYYMDFSKVNYNSTPATVKFVGCKVEGAALNSLTTLFWEFPDYAGGFEYNGAYTGNVIFE